MKSITELISFGIQQIIDHRTEGGIPFEDSKTLSETHATREFCLVLQGESDFLLDGKLYPAALNIGIAPTFGNGLHRVEIHLIGFSGSLYGRTLSVLLHRFLRPERRFDSPEELKKQIVCDVQNIMLDQHFADK